MAKKDEMKLKEQTIDEVRNQLVDSWCLANLYPNPKVSVILEIPQTYCNNAWVSEPLLEKLCKRLAEIHKDIFYLGIENGCAKIVTTRAKASILLTNGFNFKVANS